MRLALIVLMATITVFSSSASAKDESTNPRDIEPSGLSFAIGGVTFGGICFDTYLTNRVSLELDLGAIAGAGLHYHPWGADPERKWSPFVGFHGGVIPELEIDLFGDGGDEDEETTVQPDIYIPGGVHYIADSGFSLILELGYLHGFENKDAEAFGIPWAGIKIGLRL